MSGFIGGALYANIIARKDRRLTPNFQVVRKQRDREVERNAATERPGGYMNDYWPGNRAFLGDSATAVAIQRGNRSRVISRIGKGAASRVGFPGITRDQYGAPLGACTVILHRTATRELVYEGVSGADGAFLAQSVYAGENHYIVFHKAGAVNVFGATDNNLIGA
jgi:hypothetical protein